MLRISSLGHLGLSVLHDRDVDEPEAVKDNYVPTNEKGWGEYRLSKT